MNLFVIGNGFDLGHGLPTSYWDFRTYLENRYPDFLHTFEEHYEIYPRMNESKKRDLLWNELETNLANIDEDVIIENAVSMELGLESGDVGIEDTLYDYFSMEYKYIKNLAKYLKQWVRSIRIRDAKIKTAFIKNNSENMYITFNYTAVLENVYGISLNRIIHIHGSLRQYDSEPILGHGNKERIEKIKQKKNEAELSYDEKEISICRIIEEYYNQTFKDVGRYTFKLIDLRDKNIQDIFVIGHSLAGVDKLYFKNIDVFTKQKAIWNVYYYKDNEEELFYNNLLDLGIDANRIEMHHSSEFYNVK